MARAKPTEVHELKGSYLHDPQRRKAPAPKNRNPLGDPFPWLSEEERVCWIETAPTLPPGVATEADRLAFAGWMRMVARFKAGEKFTAADHTQFRNYCSMFGASPADRARLALPLDPTKPDDPAAKYFDDPN